MRPAALVLLCAVTILAVKRDAASGRPGNCSWDVLEQLRGRLDQRAAAAARRLLLDGLRCASFAGARAVWTRYRDTHQAVADRVIRLGDPLSLSLSLSRSFSESAKISIEACLIYLSDDIISWRPTNRAILLRTGELGADDTVLVCRPFFGLGNRLNALTACAYTALAHNRTMLLDWVGQQFDPDALGLLSRRLCVCHFAPRHLDTLLG